MFIFLGITLVKTSLVILKSTLNIYILQKLPTAPHLRGTCETKAVAESICQNIVFNTKKFKCIM